MVRTRHGALYTGIAIDVERRFAEHAAGGARCARYLRSKGPLTLAYAAGLGPKGLALRAEHAFKRLRRPAKQRIVAACPPPGRLLTLLGLGSGR